MLAKAEGTRQVRAKQKYRQGTNNCAHRANRSDRRSDQPEWIVCAGYMAGQRVRKPEGCNRGQQADAGRDPGKYSDG